MSSNHVIAEKPPTEQKSFQINKYASEHELETRIKNLDNLVQSVQGALRRVSFSGKLRALNLMDELRLKIKATHNMLRVAKLLGEPARESMLSKAGDSLKELEETIATHLDVEMT